MDFTWFGASNIEKRRPGYGPLDRKHEKTKKTCFKPQIYLVMVINTV